MQLRLIPTVCFGNSTFPILQNYFSQLETMMKFAGATFLQQYANSVMNYSIVQ